MDRVQKLLDIIFEKNAFQNKSICNLSKLWTSSDREQLESLLEFLMQDCSIETLAADYLLFVEDTLKESLYFRKNGSYRYSTFQEVSEKVYFDDIYMKSYMNGLVISTYLWYTHFSISRHFDQFITSHGGDQYLEIGPGHGRYFYKACQQQNYRFYTAIDLSPSSIALTERFIKFYGDIGPDNYSIELADANRYNVDHRFDCIVAMEVLEHLESPQELVRSMYRMCEKEGYIYLTVPINAPEIDHIYLFKTVDEALDMVKDAGFSIVEYSTFTDNATSLEKAIDKKRSIIVAVVAQKQ